ncbi:hypothetical protein VPH35_124176 [Triticum aestivum]
MDGSNELILPYKRKNKARGEAKNCKKSRQDPKIQLKKLQIIGPSEKQNKLLQARSIEILRNRRISVDGYSLLHASGTIGQAEILKEKLRWAVPFSRAGLIVPEELSLFKKDGFPHKFVDPTYAIKCNRNLNDRKSKNVMEKDAMKPVECKLMVDVGPKTEGTFDLSDMLANSTMKPSVPGCSHVVMDFQDDELMQEGAVVQESFNPPAVVPVSRVPYELGLKLGKELGFQVRHDKMVRSNCAIKFMTDGVLLREIQRYSVIILDVAHERSLNTDILIGMLSCTDSATLQLRDFISNRSLFDVIPLALKVPIRQFPVAIHFSKRTHDDYLGDAYKKVVASKQQTDRKPEKVEGDESSSSPEVDEKEIYEAYDDMFSTYEEDEINSGPNVYSSDIEIEGEMDTDSEDEDGSVSKFLGSAEGSSALKASFKAISRAPGVPESVEKSSDATSLEQSIPYVPCFSKCTKPMSVSHGNLRVLPLYAMLPASQQLQVFQNTPEDERLVVVATNVAETSLTIPDIKYVVDNGKQKVKNYNHATGMASYEIQAGRTGPGDCYRLYSAAAYGKDKLFPEFSEPEIKRVPVDVVVLMLRFMRINVSKFPFPTPPNNESLVEAEHSLKALEALDSQVKPTPLGKAMAQYPMSPRHSRLLLTTIKNLKSQKGFGRPNFILGYAAAAASALSFLNPFLMQNDFSGEPKEHNPDLDNEDQQEIKRQKKKIKAMVRDSRAKFVNPSSDALTIAHALRLFELSKNTVEFCRMNSLHLKTTEETSKFRKQLLRLIFLHTKSCEEFSWKFGDYEDVEEAWRSESDKKKQRRICAGWADRVAKRIHTFSASSEDARKIRAVHYQSCALSDTIYLHLSSSVVRTAPEFVFFLNKNRPYMHGVTSIKPSWLLKYASSLCTFSAPLEDREMYYDPKKDQVYCFLPLHSLPVNDGSTRSQVFACSPDFLYPEIKACFQEFHSQFGALWGKCTGRFVLRARILFQRGPSVKHNSVQVISVALRHTAR